MAEDLKTYDEVAEMQKERLLYPSAHAVIANEEVDEEAKKAVEESEYMSQTMVPPCSGQVVTMIGNAATLVGS